MLKFLSHRKSIFIFIMIFCSQLASSQLANFSLLVNHTDETCTGNATITFGASGTVPGATVIYSVYLLPDVSTAIAITSATTLTGLSSGTYRIIALESSGNDSNTQQQDVVIANSIVPLVFNLAGTPESCSNGTITTTVTQGTPVTYEIISGPIIVPPQTSNVFTGLTAGEYNVRVNDACGDGVVQTYTILPVSYLTVSGFGLNCELTDCDTATGNFSVAAIENENIIYPLTVQVTFNIPGSPPIVITQTITSGDNQVFSIPITIPFDPGTQYSYSAVVTDSCGHSFANTGSGTFQELQIGLTGQENPEDPNQINVSACNYVPPYNINFTSFPDGFNPADFNGQFPGPYTTSPITFDSTPGNEIPDGVYHVEITDACGNVSGGKLVLGACPIDSAVFPLCSGGIIFIPDEGVHVVSVILTAASPAYPQPLPYDVSFNIMDGVFSMAFPNGEYTFTVVTVCGDTVIMHFHIENNPQVTVTGGNSPGCDPHSGFIDVHLLGAGIATITILQAPSSFAFALPYDATGFVNPVGSIDVRITGLPVGDYVLTVTDICGNIFTPLNANVPLLVSQLVPIVKTLQGCEEGFGSLAITSRNTRFQQVIITSAPSSYTVPLPQDVTANVATDGVFYMNALPEGDYVIYTKDICGIEHTLNVHLNGYHVTQNVAEVQANCNSFNLLLQHNLGVPVYSLQFWLQKLNTSTGQWVHPITGVPYVSGLPTTLNSYQLFNGTVNYNIASMGTFRVVRSNYIYSTGTNAFTTCIQIIKQFDFNGDLKITAAYTVPCSSTVSEVYIVASGAPPLTYKITSKDGSPFFVDNGNSNLFTGLTSGIYNFQVQDQCGNIVNRLFDITVLPEPSIMASNLCDGLNGQLSVQAFSFLSYQWWEGNNTTAILSTTNVLSFNPFSNATSPGTYHVRIYSQSSLSCLDRVLTFVVPAVNNPNAGQDAVTGICGSTGAVDLFTLLGAPYDTNGAWEEVTASGMLTGNTWLPIGIPYGVYKFRYSVNGFCNTVDEAFVTINFLDALPQPVISVAQQNCSGSNVQLNVNQIPGVAYHWTGPNGFVSDIQNPSIENATTANSGTYTVTATNSGCTTNATANIVVSPAADFTITNDCVNKSYMLSAEPAGNYSWAGPQNYTSHDNPVTITGLAPGVYSATLTNTDGCTFTKSVTIANTRCSVSSGISPNGDGDNDAFDLTGFDVLKLEIFSRYGRLVYEQDNYTNQWHGQDYKDRDLPDATYYYYIRLKAGEELTGWVYVTKP